VPAGLSGDPALPLGLQLIAKPFDEADAVPRRPPSIEAGRRPFHSQPRAGGSKDEKQGRQVRHGADQASKTVKDMSDVRAEIDRLDAALVAR
jgi:hypothetical protein